jgi:hypothetical protein
MDQSEKTNLMQDAGIQRAFCKKTPGKRAGRQGISRKNELILQNIGAGLQEIAPKSSE